MKKFIRIILFIFLWLILNFAFYVAEGAGRPRPGTLIASFFITGFLFLLFKKLFKPKKFLLNKKVNIETKSKDLSSEILIENKVPKNRIISKGWVRLQIVSSLLLPIPLAYLYFKFFEFFSSGGLEFPSIDNEFWGYVAVLFVFQWLLFLFYFLIIKYKSSIISNLWLGRHFFVSIFSGFVINYFFLIPVFDLENIPKYYFWEYSYYFPIFVVVYFFILLTYLWIARGFKDS